MLEEQHLTSTLEKVAYPGRIALSELALAKLPLDYLCKISYAKSVAIGQGTSPITSRFFELPFTQSHSARPGAHELGVSI